MERSDIQKTIQYLKRNGLRATAQAVFERLEENGETYTYEPVEEQKVSGALIHPYYPVSQRAYRAAGDIAASLRKDGLDVQQANHIHIKSILGRLPFLRRGRNTLSYMGLAGSRFHVQILTADEEIPVTDDLYETEREYSCGKCRRCMGACPGGAITDDGFERERCLRWRLPSSAKA